MAENRTFDGSGNNVDNPTWGKANEPLLRLTTPGYSSGGSEPRSGPNPRAISNDICEQEEPSRGPHAKLSNYMWAWGQFLDHELDLSLEDDSEPLNMKAPANDSVAPGATIPFHRSKFDPSTGTDSSNPRQQINVLPAYIDATNVYGSSCERATALRALDGTGRLKISHSKRGDLLPYNTMELPNAQGPLRGGDPKKAFFVAGDVRSNEHNVLTCMHTLFAREHNLICRQLAKGKNAALRKEIKRVGRDEAIFQRARKIVGALEQVVTFEEFLPALLGPKAIPRYRRYKPKVNASIANVFSTAAYRLGHDMLNESVLLVTVGRPAKCRRLALDKSFWKPQQVKRLGIEVFLNGLARQNMEQIDVQTVEAVRSRLFNVFDPSANGNMLLDLASLNIQRGRDHGLPSYNQCRADFNLKPKSKFSDITTDPVILDRLQKAYDSVDDIDPWIGGLAEKPHRKAIVGEFFYTVLRDQFLRLRDGDRFWYENDPAFTKREVAKLKRTRLSDIIKRNTKIRKLKKNVFFT